MRHKLREQSFQKLVVKKKFHFQSAYHVIKPDILKNRLTDELKIEQERAAAISTVWGLNASLIVESLRKRSVLPYQVIHS